MAYQQFFKRYELKYILTDEQKNYILDAISPYMRLDGYGRTLIRNLYYDTDSFRLIRRSIEKPMYKEKLRLRAYGEPLQGERVFVELKKKCDGVVYKRRIALTEDTALSWLGGADAPMNGQIFREIGYFRDYYAPLSPKVALSYEREAFYSEGNPDLRLTFDYRIFARTGNLNLGALGGEPILSEGYTLMEIKTSGGMPMWLASALSRGMIYKSAFSKYGAAYKNLIFKGEYINA